MNQNLQIALGVLVILAVGGWVYFLYTNSSNVPNTTSPPSKKQKLDNIVNRLKQAGLDRLSNKSEEMLQNLLCRLEKELPYYELYPPSDGCECRSSTSSKIGKMKDGKCHTKNSVLVKKCSNGKLPSKCNVKK